MKKSSIIRISKRNWHTAIIARNKKYDALSKPEKVVELCKDALFNILADFLTPINMSYLKLDTDNIKLSSGLQPLIPVLKSNHDCRVCAKGALVVSCVSFKNEFSVRDARNILSHRPAMLAEEFTKKEYDKIEEIFENATPYSRQYGIPGYSLIATNSDTNERLRTTKIRMIHIFAMIIQFRGEVLPALTTHGQPLNLRAVFNQIDKTYRIPAHARTSTLQLMKPYLKPKN